MASTDVFFRLLSRLDASVLQDHCSDVVDDELRKIQRSLREVKAAYERLQEVREAVAKLEQGRSDVRRSASLHAVVESTSVLHSDLSHSIDRVQLHLASQPLVKRKAHRKESTREDTEPAEKKRKTKTTEHESSKTPKKKKRKSLEGIEIKREPSLPPPSSSSESESDYEDNRVPAKPTTSAKDKKRDSRDDPHNELRAIDERDREWHAAVSRCLKFATKCVRKDYLPVSSLSSICEQVAYIVDGVHSTPASRFADFFTAEFRNVIGTSTRVFKEQASNPTTAPVVEKFLAVMDPSKCESNDLKKLFKRCVTDLRMIRHPDSEKTPRPVPSKSPKDTDTPMMRLLTGAHGVLTMRVSERGNQAVTLVRGLQLELRRDFPEESEHANPSKEVYQTAADATKLVIELIQDEDWPSANESAYRRLLELLHAISSRYIIFKQLAKRACDDLNAYLSQDKPPSSVAKGSQNEQKAPTKPKEQKKSSKMPHNEQGLIKQVESSLQSLREWDDGVFSLKQFDQQVVQILKRVVPYQSRTWDVSRVAELVSLAIKRANSIQKQEHRYTRLAQLSRFQDQIAKRSDRASSNERERKHSRIE
ncbi:hypothetical protein Poli38472_011036 [Pythium oligandrum]|uniref:Uncharacterized protein n=1 Tax=Pythium oligandrum TaxID=41045 RepID=A0A8K1CPH2_PYTOL|nr:hypothetical protein Poli38472_011036 [Pythium oligandrum]|eukprot:TMW67416.1 hypothetical protein Poli38472_011036 [Pythium oligandrum]